MRAPYHSDAKTKLDFYSAPPNRNGCRLWTGLVNEDGYGKIWFEGKLHSAHRLRLSLKLKRPVKRGLYALHTCHTPACTEESHLYEGNQQANMNDMKAAGRQRSLKGDANPNTKWRVTLKSKIASDPRSNKEIIAQYGISGTHLVRLRREHGQSRQTGRPRLSR